MTVAIVNYNGRACLDELLHSLEHQTCRNFETLLIDNASSDGSSLYVQDNFRWVRVLEQKSNLGFAKAGNLAAKLAAAPFLALLNTDLKLEPAWLEEMLVVARQDPKIAAVASKMRLYHQPHLLNGVGGCMNRIGYTWDRGMFEEDRGQYDREEEVLFASAGAALFRRALFLQSGGFDEAFFMYHEDVDLCWRFWILGHRVLTAPRAVCHHHFGASTKESHSPMWRELLGERNSIRTLLKNYEWRNLLPALLRLGLLRQPLRRKKGQFLNFAWNLGKIAGTLKERRSTQRRRKRRDAEISRLIVQSDHVPVRL